MVVCRVRRVDPRQWKGGQAMIGITRIDYAAEAKQREDWKAWLQAKAAERRLSEPSDKVNP